MNIRIRSFACVVLTFFIVFFQLSISANSNDKYGNVYCRNPSNSKKIALTFDDGPHPKYTEEILDILEEYGITATFFIIGINAENYPEAFNKIILSDCEIGNHTYSHKRINKMTSSEISAEISKCEETLYAMSGIRPNLFRPPEGYMPNCLKNVVSKVNYNVVLWSIDTKDWALTPPIEIFNTVMKNIKGGDIILMHDYVSGGNTTCDALKMIIPALLAQGYDFVTVSSLLRS